MRLLSMAPKASKSSRNLRTVRRQKVFSDEMRLLYDFHCFFKEFRCLGIHNTTVMAVCWSVPASAVYIEHSTGQARQSVVCSRLGPDCVEKSGVTPRQIIDRSHEAVVAVELLVQGSILGRMMFDTRHKIVSLPDDT